MQEETKQSEPLSAEIQDVMRNLVIAFRAVKLYPSNNPIYSQSIKKSYEVLDHFLKTTPEYRIGVQKTYFMHMQTPIGKETQLNKSIAQDLFAKGIREIVFSAGMVEAELVALCQALALSEEELAMKSGITSILWEKGAEHIKVIEAGLDEVITTDTPGSSADKTNAKTAVGVLDPSTAKEAMILSGRTLVLGDIMADPASFGASMLELAKKTKAEYESVEDRLFTLYQEAGHKIQEEHPDQADTLFEGLAKSVLSLESPYRQAMIAGKLYADMDSEMVSKQTAELEEMAPSELHEILTGRFSDSWTTQQVTTLLKRSAAKKIEPSAPPPSPDALEVIPIPQNLATLAKEMSEYTPEEMEAIKAMGEEGMESDIIEATVRTFISLLALVKDPKGPVPGEKEVSRFSGVVHQLEGQLNYLLKKKDYTLAALILQAFQMPAHPAFKRGMTEALKRTASKSIVSATIADMRKYTKSSSEYRSAHNYLSAIDREATEIMLELLAEETDRSARIFILDLVKDVGKNQIQMFGERLSDGRWYVVRNIVNILGEIKTDQAIAFLRRAVEHKDIRIRQEVIKGLLAIGGKKAASVLAKCLNDKDLDIQLMVIRGFSDMSGIRDEDVEPLLGFLENRPIKKRYRELTLEAIKSLGMIGGRKAREFLDRYTRIRWWKPRRLQKELRDAAQHAIDEITRRQSDGRAARR
ncbi:MAG: HEAT repeat domain-containing protein [Betaproteobacteria bacterium]